MANRYFTSQFMYNFERQAVMLLGSFTQSGSAGSFASRTTQGVTLTAKRMGTYGNGITIAFTGGGTAGSEVVTVTGKAISVQVESGVSTVTQVVAAINGSAAALALVTPSGAAITTVSTAAALALTGGVDTSFTSTAKGFSLLQIDTGTYEITLQDTYSALLYFGGTTQDSSGSDRFVQVKSADPSSSKLIVFRTQTGANAADMASGDVIYVQMILRNSGS